MTYQDDLDTTALNLHDLVQSIHAVQEEMNGIIEQIDYLVRTHKIVMENGQFGHSDCVLVDSLEYLRSRTMRWHHWLRKYRERTKAQIRLYFNLSTQRDNKTNVKIAELTSKIAKETQRDSSSMIT